MKPKPFTAAPLEDLPPADFVSPCGSVVLYNRDSLDLIPGLPAGVADTWITDPVWPGNSVPQFAGIDAYSLFTAVVSSFAASRLVVHLGVDSDPRILAGIPAALPFLRVCWLRFARPSYKGRLLNGSEVAYVFGKPVPASCFPGRQHLMPGESHTDGEVTCVSNERRFPGHPCPRRLSHVEWLVKHFSENSVFDPFAGSGTTGIAAIRNGRRFVGCEINAEFFDLACHRFLEEHNRMQLFNDASQSLRGGLIDET